MSKHFISPTHLALGLSNGVAHNPNGGSLYRGAVEPTSGYIVRDYSVKSLRLAPRSVKRIRLFESRSTATGAILNWGNWNWENIDMLDCVGWWIDDETNFLHIDANEIFHDFDKAVAAGVDRGELAIYDIAKGNSIPLV